MQMDELDILMHKKKTGQTFTHEDCEVLALLIQKLGAESRELVDFLESLNTSNFSAAETAELAKRIAMSGRMLKVSEKVGPCISKDSAGNISDGASLIVMSVLASLGVKIVKMTTTKYGHFGNTITRLKSVGAFDENVGVTKFLSIVEKVGCAVFENRGAVATGDIKLGEIMEKFAVPSIPMIAVSFLAKKIGLGANIVIYDVKSGEGGIVKSNDDAYKLGKYLVEASKIAGLVPACAITSLNQPVGASIGGKHELKEVVRSLSSGDSYFDSDMMTIAKEIVEIALILSKQAKGRADASEMFDDAVLSGRALSKFKEIVLALGGDFDELSVTNGILNRVATSYLEAEKEGYLSDVQTAGLYDAYRVLAGEYGTQSFDSEAGIVMLVREGAKVREGEKIARVVYGFDNERFSLALSKIRDAFSVKTQKPKREKLLVKVFV